MLCLVVEYTGEDIDFPPFTRSHPGSTIDLMVEPAAGTREAPRTMLVLVRGAPMAATDALVAEMARTKAPLEALRRDPAESLWFGRVHFRPADLASPSARALAGLAQSIGPPWVHVESGVVHLRARLRDEEWAEEVLQAAEKDLGAAGLDAQVVVQEVSPKDHSVWESLVRHGIGLSL
jgi:hypothetical protein